MFNHLFFLSEIMLENMSCAAIDFFIILRLISISVMSQWHNQQNTDICCTAIKLFFQAQVSAICSSLSSTHPAFSLFITMETDWMDRSTAQWLVWRHKWQCKIMTWYIQHLRDAREEKPHLQIVCSCAKYCQQQNCEPQSFTLNTTHQN